MQISSDFLVLKIHSYGYPILTHTHVIATYLSGLIQGIGSQIVGIHLGQAVPTHWQLQPIGIHLSFAWQVESYAESYGYGSKLKTSRGLYIYIYKLRSIFSTVLTNSIVGLPNCDPLPYSKDFQGTQLLDWISASDPLRHLLKHLLPWRVMRAEMRCVAVDHKASLRRKGSKN